MIDPHTLVWAKLRGYSPWPGRIVDDPPQSVKRRSFQKNSKCIFFFGTNNFAYVEDANLKDFFKFKDKLNNSCKTSSFKEAVRRIEAYISDPEKFKFYAEPPDELIPTPSDAAFNKLRENENDDILPSTSFPSPSTSFPSPSRPAAKKKGDKPKSVLAKRNSPKTTATTNNVNANNDYSASSSSGIGVGGDGDGEGEVAGEGAVDNQRHGDDDYEANTSGVGTVDTDVIGSSTSDAVASGAGTSGAGTSRAGTSGRGSRGSASSAAKRRKITQQRINNYADDDDDDDDDDDNNNNVHANYHDEIGAASIIENNNDHEANSGSYFPKRHITASKLIGRPSLMTRVQPSEINLSDISPILIAKKIQPSPLRFGFLGLGIMGSGMVKNLINSGHSVCVWNRTIAKCRKFNEAGATFFETPCDVIDNTDITFACVSDPMAAKEMVFGNCGVLASNTLSDGKGYVEMTSIDSETSQDIYEAVITRGGRYLEAQIQGNKIQSEEGSLIILAAGERLLFDECQSCFEAVSKNSFFLGDVGNATKMNLVLQTIHGITLVGLAEGMALADRAGLKLPDLLEVLSLTNMSSPLMIQKGKAMLDGEFPTHHPLVHMQKDLRLALAMSDGLEQPLPLAASANEVFKHAKRLGFDEHDSSAVYVRSRF